MIPKTHLTVSGLFCEDGLMAALDLLELEGKMSLYVAPHNLLRACKMVDPILTHCGNVTIRVFVDFGIPNEGYYVIHPESTKTVSCSGTS